jgi:hypothetical protein
MERIEVKREEMELISIQRFENGNHNHGLETEGWMARLIGSHSTSSPIWNSYKMDPNDPGHPFFPPANHRRRLTVSSRPTPSD